MAKRILIGLLIAVAMVNSAWSKVRQKKEMVKIGAILSLSGPSSSVGEDVRDGLLLAADEINHWGGINGKKIELIISDSKTDKQEGKEAFKRIEKAHHPLVYLSDITVVSLGIAPLAEENKVGVIALASTAPELTKQNKWIFRYFSTAKEQVPPILSILAELKVKKLGMIYINDEYGRSFFELAKSGFEKMGGIIRGELYETKEDNFYFKEQIAKLKDMEAIYIVVRNNHWKNIFKQLKREGFAGVIATAGSAGTPEVRSLPEANGVYLVAPAIYNPKFLYAKKVSKKYEAKYSKPFSHYAAGGYDIIHLLVNLLEDKEILRENVKNLLEEGFINPGIFGEINVKPGEHDLGYPLHPAQIIDGKIKYLY